MPRLFDSPLTVPVVNAVSVLAPRMCYHCAKPGRYRCSVHNLPAGYQAGHQALFPTSLQCSPLPPRAQLENLVEDDSSVV